MHIISMSPPSGAWFIIKVVEEGKVPTLRSLKIEQWALVSFERHDGEAAYRRGREIFPMVMSPSGLQLIMDEIGAKGSPFLGYESTEWDATVASELKWDQLKENYLRSKAPC